MSGRPFGAVSRLLERVRTGQVRAHDSAEVDDALGQRLTAFGRRELSASDETLRRMEDEMVAAFRRASGGVDGARRPAHGPLRVHRPATALVLLTVLLVGLSSVAVAESGPGHLFYRARLAVETFTLPARSSENRVEAQLDRLTLRLNEAGEAARRGDVRAVGEAMEAYRQTLNEVVQLSRSHPGKVEFTMSVLEGDLRALKAMAARLPAEAPAGVREALEQTLSASRAIDLSR